MDRTTLLRISAGVGALGVILGAFGAHGLEKTLEANGRVETWETAVFYHFVHAIMLWLVADRPTLHRGAWRAFFIGIVIFSGTLYALSLTNIKWLGAITPIGGVSLIVGWCLLAVSPGAKESTDES